MPKPRIVLVQVKRILAILAYMILIGVGIPIVGMAWNEIIKVIGLKPVPVPVIGTGSMYPSLFWSTSEGGPEDESLKLVEEYRSTPHLYNHWGGIQVFGQTYGKRTIGHGDMVAFQNVKTQEILTSEGKNPSGGFIKRVVGLPGDTIELRDGFVYRNSELIKEPYIATPRSTYGGSSLADCVKLVVEPGKYFVLGDNRKVSSDSRFELGLIDESDIQFVLPYYQQSIYVSLYRDTSADSALLGEPSLESREFLSLLNARRSAAKRGDLALASSLNQSSRLRGTKLLQDSNTDYGMKQAVSDAGYFNIVLGEFISYGHFSAEELLENLLFNQNTAQQVLSSEFDDLGVSVVNREVNGCPAQVIVGHLGGYVPPDYDTDMLESWKSLQASLYSVIPSWESAIGNERVNQVNLMDLLTILKRRQTLAQEIIQAIENRAWFTPAQEFRIESDKEDAQKAEQLASKLNGS